MNAVKCMFMLLLGLGGSLPCLAAAENPPLQVVGSAYDQRSGDLLYSEFHYCTRQALQCSVEYRDSYGALIAHKELDYRAGPHRPSLVMKDFRRELDLSMGSGDREDLVVDAGFDNFVRTHWDALSQGERVSFPFLVVGFEKPLNMSATRHTADNCPNEDLCLEISLDSWFLGLLTDPIELVYSRSERQLRRFQGVSNIRGEKGESLTVDIHYRYGEEILLVGPELDTGDSGYNF